MSIKDYSDDTGNKFLLSATDPNKKTINFMCIPSSKELHQEWVSQINEILKKQIEFMFALTNPTKSNNKTEVSSQN